MTQFFTSFYALPLDKAFTMIFAFTYIIMFLNSVLENKKLKKAVYLCIFFLSLAGIVYITIISRAGSNVKSVSFIPFKSYMDVANGANPEILRSNFMNVMLFYPLGLFLTLLANKKRKLLIALFMAILFSISIELIQFRFSLGYVETDDVIHNTLGFILGIAAEKGFNRYFNYIY